MGEPSEDFGGQPPDHQLHQGTTPRTLHGFFKPRGQFSNRRGNRGRGSFRGSKRPTPYTRTTKDEAPASKAPQIGSKQQGSSLQIHPISTSFQVFTSNQGLLLLSDVVFNYIKMQNPKINISLRQTKYITCLAFWNRLAHLNHFLGYSKNNYRDTFILNQLADNLLLPAAISQYVSTLGSVQLASGTTLVPALPIDPAHDEQYLFPSEFWEPLDEANIPDPPNNYWCVDASITTMWNQAISKGGKTDLGLKRIDQSITTGTVSMAVSFQPNHEDENQGMSLSPTAMTRSEAEIGGAFYFRNYLEYSDWPGDNAELLYAQFLTPPVNRRVILNELCLRSARPTV